MTDPIEPSTSTINSDSNPKPSPTILLHPQREPFERILLPTQKLIFTEPVQSLTPLKQKASSSSTHRLGSADLVDVLHISSDHGCLILNTLSLVLHSESHPLVTVRTEDVHSVGANEMLFAATCIGLCYHKLMKRPINFHIYRSTWLTFSLFCRRLIACGGRKRRVYET